MLDARDPLRYRSEDLEAYAAEQRPSKPSLLLLNKSDLLSARLRLAWADYFDQQGVDYVFWSAKAAADAAAAAAAQSAPAFVHGGHHEHVHLLWHCARACTAMGNLRDVWL